MQETKAIKELQALILDDIRFELEKIHNLSIVSSQISKRAKKSLDRAVIHLGNAEAALTELEEEEK